MDSDGYPTDEELVKIARWDCYDFPALMDYIKPMLKRYGRFRKEFDIYIIATGGWSGNESIISALQNNTMFWMICWKCSKRGGYFEFEVKNLNERGLHVAK